MRSLSFDPNSPVELPALITIQRGTVTLRWNTSDRDVTIDGETWTAEGGALVTSLDCNSDGTENNADITIHTRAGGPVEPGDGARGLLDGWPISVKLFDPSDTTTATEMMPGAIVGSVQEDANGIATIAASGQLIKASVELTEHYSLTGREDLGDDRCKIPILPADIGRGVAFVRPDIATGLLHVNDAYGRMLTAGSYGNVYYECTAPGTTDATTAPTYDPTIGNSTVDGGVTFIARNAWTRSATGEATSAFEIVLDALPDPRALDPTWYALGALYVRSGALEDYPKFPIREWNPATLTVTLFLPVAVADIPADTALEIAPGCDNTREMCFSRFNNIVNLRAETFVPPPRARF